jgi:hypothetical protein
MVVACITGALLFSDMRWLTGDRDGAADDAKHVQARPLYQGAGRQATPTGQWPNVNHNPSHHGLSEANVSFREAAATVVMMSDLQLREIRLHSTTQRQQKQNLPNC